MGERWGLLFAPHRKRVKSRCEMSDLCSKRALYIHRYMYWYLYIMACVCRPSWIVRCRRALVGYSGHTRTHSRIDSVQRGCR